MNYALVSTSSCNPFRWNRFGSWGRGGGPICESVWCDGVCMCVFPIQLYPLYVAKSQVPLFQIKNTHYHCFMDIYVCPLSILIDCTVMPFWHHPPRVTVRAHKLRAKCYTWLPFLQTPATCWRSWGYLHFQKTSYKFRGSHDPLGFGNLL